MEIDEVDEYLEILLERETSSFRIQRFDSSEFSDTIKSARSEAIDWILNTTAVFGFRSETAYLSSSYFDRFLSSRIIKNGELWVCKLLAVACLSLAAKVAELTAPRLSEFRFHGCNFKSSVISRMELLVLNTLDWKMISVTPFAFIDYLTTKFCREAPPSHVASSSVEFIFCFIREESLINHRPFAIAAAATLMAVDQRLTRKSLELKMNSISRYKAVEFEDVFACYDFMKKMKKVESSKFVKSQPNGMRPRGVAESPSVTAAVSCKRKRVEL